MSNVENQNSPPNLDFIHDLAQKENFANLGSPLYKSTKKIKSRQKISQTIQQQKKSHDSKLNQTSQTHLKLQNQTQLKPQNQTQLKLQNQTTQKPITLTTPTQSSKTKTPEKNNTNSNTTPKNNDTPSRLNSEIKYPFLPSEPVVSPNEKEKKKKNNSSFDYYNLLNVPRDCSTEQLKKSYKRLALTTHPDRHSQNAQLEGELYENAKDNFQLIKTAYETLIDEKKRMIYDLYGKDGLDAGWDLVDLSGKKKEEVKQIFDEISRKKIEKQEEEERKVEMSGKITVSLKSNELFSKDILCGKKTIPQVADMTITQSATIFENQKTTLKMGGTIGQYQKMGHGSLNFEIFHRFSNFFWMESKAVSTGEHTFLELGLFKKISPLIKIYIKGLLYNNTSTGISLGIEKQICPVKKCCFSWNFGRQPEISLGLNYGMQNENNEIRDSRFETAIFARAFGSYGIKYKHQKDISKKMTLEISTEISQDGYGSLSLGGKRKISKFKKMGIFVSYDLDGISWGFSYETGNQEFKLPLVLWSEFSLKNVLTAFLTPTITWTLLKVLYLNPKRRERKRIKEEKRRNEIILQTEKTKKEAQAAIKLMTSVSLRRKQEESSKKGLIIISALYGEIEISSNSNPISEIPDSLKTANVTIPLQYLVENSQLHLYAGSKESILGFYNPDPMKDLPPKLYVRYLFKDLLHQVIIDDHRPLHIPRSSHKIIL